MDWKSVFKVFCLTAVLTLAVGISPVLAYNLPGTGQTTCYDNSQEIPCPAPGEPFYGQDASYQHYLPAFLDNGDGTVSDLNTGLMWQQSDLQNDGGGRIWQDAVDYCGALGLGNRLASPKSG